MKRIVSLVPSLTQTIVDFGCLNQIVGCTNFCVDPPSLHKSAALIGGTKDPHIERIKELAPTHIIVNTEENRQQDIAACQRLAPVIETFPKSIVDVPGMILSLGKFLGCQDIAGTMALELQEMLYKVRTVPRDAKQINYLYFIWRNPYMVAGRDTYIASILNLLGWINLAPNRERYPTIGIEEINQMEDLDLILLSTEPYPFRKRDALRLREELTLRSTRARRLVRLAKIDGKMMSWYGSESLKAARILSRSCIDLDEIG